MNDRFCVVHLNVFSVDECPMCVKERLKRLGLDKRFVR